MLYYHFPGGKTELAVAVIDATVARRCDNLDRALADNADPGPVLIAWIGAAQKRLDASGYERGCPLPTIALETTAEDGVIRAALAQGFARARSTARHADTAPPNVAWQSTDIDPHLSGLGPIGHMGYFKAHCRPLWEGALGWLEQHGRTQPAGISG